MANRNILTKRAPPSPKQETFEGYGDPADKEKVVGIPFRRPNLENLILRNALRYEARGHQRIIPLF
jgi:hypothetical protein